MRGMAQAIVWSLLALGAASACAAEPEAALPGPGVTVLHLAQRAERTLPRDRLRAVLSVDATTGTPQQVQAEVNRRMSAALARVHQVASVKSETGGYSVYQEHPPNQPAHWRGRQTLTLLGEKPTDLLDLVGDLQQQGLATGGLSFELTPEAARHAEDALTEEALGDLRRRAERVAQGLGLAVQQIRDVTVGNVEGGPRPPIPMAMMRAGAAAAPPPVAEAGEATVAVTVEANFWLGSR